MRLIARIECLLHGHIWYPVQRAGWSQCLRCNMYRDTYKKCVKERGREG